MSKCALATNVVVNCYSQNTNRKSTYDVYEDLNHLGYARCILSASMGIYRVVYISWMMHDLLHTGDLLGIPQNALLAGVGGSTVLYCVITFNQTRITTPCMNGCTTDGCLSVSILVFSFVDDWMHA